MNYFLISFLLLVSHNGAEDINAENTTQLNDSFSVHIGAGYGVGIDQLSNILPKSTTKINKSRNYLSNILSRETTPIVREPRTLTNFTLQVENSKAENAKYQVEPKNHIFDSNAAASNNIGTNNVRSYQVHEMFSEDENKFSNTKPSLLDLQKIVSGIEKGQQYSKILQVIKVPAIYEIHLQSDIGKKNHESSHPGNFNNGHLQWNNHYNNKPSINNFNLKENANWRTYYEINEPKFSAPLVSDEYLKWLNNYYKQREETFSGQPEKYRNNYKSSATTSHEKYIKPEWMNDHIHQSDILEPIISHHYSHTNYFDDKFDDNGITINYSNDANNQHSNPWQNKKHFPHYANSNLKRDIPSPSSNKFPANTNFFNSQKHRKDFNLKSEPFKQNQEITEYNQPQAIYEVPAPYLGKYPHPRPFEAQPSSKIRTYSKPIPTLQNYQDELNHAQFNNYIPKQNIYDSPILPTAVASFDTEQNVFPNTVYSLVSEKYHNLPIPETMPPNDPFISHANENQNLIYGKQSEAVRSPYEINIPATTATNFYDNQEHVIYKDTQNFQYPANVNYLRGSNYDGVYNPNILVHNKIADNRIQNQDSTENINIYENVPITTHIPDTNLYDKNQATFNQKSDTNVYKENNEKIKEQDNINSESKSTQDSKKSVLTDKYNNLPVKESPQVAVSKGTNNMPNKRFRQKQYVNNSPLRRRTRKQTGGHLDYIIYITEKS